MCTNGVDVYKVPETSGTFVHEGNLLCIPWGCPKYLADMWGTSTHPQDISRWRHRRSIAKGEVCRQVQLVFETVGGFTPLLHGNGSPVKKFVS